MGYVQTVEPGEFTFADLDALPDDGMQYELVDGMLLVTPSPTPLHQRAVLRLAITLEACCPEALEVFIAPLDFRPTTSRSLQPDVIVARREDVGPRAIERPPLLAVEVLSPATRSKDLLLKRALYEEAGVKSYWIFEPQRQELTVLELSDGTYTDQVLVQGDHAFEAQLPYPVRIVPADLIR